MDAFWGITLSLLVIRAFWNRRNRERREADKRVRESVHKPLKDKETEKLKEELRKEGVAEELITVIIPTINNGQ